jgi:predicted glycoside hydrolase/deacetylase ChbG (UPF0249 family)
MSVSSTNHIGGFPIMPPVPFILIADDYALTDGVSRAICELLDKGRLSGTGAMTNQPGWPSLAPALQPFFDKRDLGLHLTLTLGAPLGNMPKLAADGVLPTLGKILSGALSGQLSRNEIAEEIIRQIGAFEDHTGRLPDFIDGHQHVHVLPTVRAALFEAIERYRSGWRPWLRVPADRLGSIMARGKTVGKSLFIALLAQGLAASARKRGFPVNDSFSGVSDFKADGSFADDFRRYLLVAGRSHLVMCHPGHSDAALAALDPVTKARDEECAFLNSDAFDTLMTSMNMRVARFSETA